jgi:hypothetical protein
MSFQHVRIQLTNVLIHSIDLVISGLGWVITSIQAGPPGRIQTGAAAHIGYDAQIVQETVVSIDQIKYF